jgi:hypothetical protein
MYLCFYCYLCDFFTTKLLYNLLNKVLTVKFSRFLSLSLLGLSDLLLSLLGFLGEILSDLLLSLLGFLSLLLLDSLSFLGS